MKRANPVNHLEAFGVKTSFHSADLILIPVPWEVTVSYGEGTALGPELIRKASSQLDFFNSSFNKSYNNKIHFEQPDTLITSLSKTSRIWAKDIQKNWEEDHILNAKEKKIAVKVNQACESLMGWLYEKSAQVLQEKKIPALVGGEHSVSEGLIRVIGEKYEGKYGLLHIDAHADLRESYQGFQYSHASVMHNVLNLNFPPQKLIQVGVRDFSEKEYHKITTHKTIHCFFDKDISSRLFEGEKWSSICQKIVRLLPSKVYISLDVDALSWSYAPGTGTPVPGGLSFNQLLYLFLEIKKQKKRLIAFDVVETSSGQNRRKDRDFSEWNGNVAARLIYYLSGLALTTTNKL